MALASAKIWKWIFLKIDIFGRFFVIYDEMEASWCDAPPISLQVWLTPEEKIFVTFISSQKCRVRHVAFFFRNFLKVVWWPNFSPLEVEILFRDLSLSFRPIWNPLIQWKSTGNVFELKKRPGVEFGDDARTTFFSLKMINF